MEREPEEAFFVALAKPVADIQKDRAGHRSVVVLEDADAPLVLFDDEEAVGAVAGVLEVNRAVEREGGKRDLDIDLCLCGGERPQQQQRHTAECAHGTRHCLDGMVVMERGGERAIEAPNTLQY